MEFTLCGVICQVSEPDPLRVCGFKEDLLHIDGSSPDASVEKRRVLAATTTTIRWAYADSSAMGACFDCAKRHCGWCAVSHDLYCGVVLARNLAPGSLMPAALFGSAAPAWQYSLSCLCAIVRWSTAEKLLTARKIRINPRHCQQVITTFNEPGFTHWSV